MANVLVRDLDETALETLKCRAKREGRTLGAELKRIIEQAAGRVDMKTARSLADDMTNRLRDRLHTEGVELLREDRGR